MTLPEDLDALPMDAVEVVDDSPKPRKRQANVRPFEANFPPEAIKQIEDLKNNLARKDKQIEQVMGAYREIKGETEKLRERIKKVERRKFEQSKGDFIARFVEVLDNLDRAIESIENNFDSDSVLQGIILVRSRLVQLLREEGLEKIFVGGQAFDPTYSEAAGMEEVGSAEEDGVVLKELQRGYLLKGALLRAARVIVGRFSGDADPAAQSSAPATNAPPIPPIPAAPAPASEAPLPSAPGETAQAPVEAHPDAPAPSPPLAPEPEVADPILDELDNFITAVPDPTPAQTIEPVPRPAPTPRFEAPNTGATETNAPPAPEPHTSAPLPPDSDDTLIQEPPAPIPDLLVPPEHFPDNNTAPPAESNTDPKRAAGSPLLQDDIFEQEADALELELQGLELEPDDQDFID